MGVNKSIQDAIKTISNQSINDAPYDKTRGGIITGIGKAPNAYSVQVDGVVYSEVRSVGGYSFMTGDNVRVMLPTNNPSQMFILAPMALSPCADVEDSLLLLEKHRDEQLHDKITALGWSDAIVTPPLVRPINLTYHGRWVNSQQFINGKVVYKSRGSYHVNDAWDTTKITFSGVTDFTIHIRSNGENNYDYMLVSTLDNDTLANCTSTNAMRSMRTDTRYVKADTRGQASSTTYTAVTFSGINPNTVHYFYIIYQKDNGSHSNEDAGFFYVG